MQVMELRRQFTMQPQICVWLVGGNTYDLPDKIHENPDAAVLFEGDMAAVRT
jgi:hypothetical protein